ncbi:nitronate monooxygenase family protein, partial [Prevotella pectinovora]
NQLIVLADVASIRHAERAVAAGADGLVLLTAGAGGQTGWLNPFAFVRAVRQFFQGPLVLADVASIRHAERAVAAGADGLVLLTAGAGGQTGWLNP